MFPASTKAAANALRRRAGGLGRKALDTLLPPQCLITAEPVAAHGSLSPAAWGQLTFIEPPFCRACGRPFETEQVGLELCGACNAPDGFAQSLTSSKGLDRLRAALVYDDFSAQLILALKYGDRLDGVPALARMLARAGQDILAGAPLLVPVPLHRKRLLRRRFNQAALLAGALAAQEGLDIEMMALVRHRATPQQQGLSAKARARNVRGAFHVPAEKAALVKGRSIVLIDDVLTTGSTLMACAKVLKRAGAADVNGLVLARVVHEHKSTI